MICNISNVSALALLCTLLPSTLAHPRSYSRLAKRSDITADQITQIAQETKDCNGGDYPLECTDAEKAAPFINTSFMTYNISSNGQKASILALMIYESGNFKYARGHFGDHPPGKGTRNMQSAAFNAEYAKSISALAPQLNGVTDPEAITDLLISYGDYDFGSAAWFLTNKCTPDLRAKMDAVATNVTGAYVDCLGAGPETLSDREKLFQTALTALGGK